MDHSFCKILLKSCLNISESSIGACRLGWRKRKIKFEDQKAALWQLHTKRGVSGERLSTVDLAVEPYSAHLGKLKGLPVATRYNTGYFGS
ncbi:hypothetical protein QL285_013268 [Trifolium repens]|nr:hypothetical protein QL285_013268 [Trifolium repens]